MGLNSGLAAASLCINRRLAGIASARSVLVDRKQKRRSVVVDLIIGVGIPVAVMAASYVFQPHRFDIMEGVGCEPVLWSCIGMVLLIQLPPIALNLVSAAYGGKFTYFSCRELTPSLCHPFLHFTEGSSERRSQVLPEWSRS